MGVEADKTAVITRLTAQVQKLLPESGNCEPFDAAAWVERWLRRPNFALSGAATEIYLGPPEKDAVVAAQQRWLIASL